MRFKTIVVAGLLLAASNFQADLLAAEISPPTAPSSDLINAIAKLLQVASKPEDKSFISSDHIHSFSEVLSAAAWPTVIIVAMIIFRVQFRALLLRIRKVELAGQKLEANEEVQNEIKSSAAAVLTSPSSQPPANVSAGDIERSAKVAALSQGSQPEEIRLQIEKIASEYEGVRANMPSGPARTKQMSAVMAKMRTLGRTVYPYRLELIRSPSPGTRLFAIAALQMLPDYDLLDWLAERIKTETPYVQFQALNALLIAVRNAGSQMKRKLMDAAVVAKSNLLPSDPDTSRLDLVKTIISEIERIPDPIDQTVVAGLNSP